MKRRVAPKSLKVFFDESCAFCLRIVEVFQGEECYAPMRFLPMRESSKLPEYHRIAPHVASGRFVAMDEEGRIYLDTNARLMLLYMTKRYRGLSFDLSAPGIHQLVDAAFEQISRHRKVISHLLAEGQSAAIRERLCGPGGCGT